jgi:hypothetical protein
MARVRLSLDGIWEFAPDPKDLYQSDRLPQMRSITVPGGWETQFPSEAGAFGRGWYRKTVFIPPDWRDRAVFLRFGAVNYHCRVWVNGTLVGEHEGGYTPFDFRIDPQLKQDAENEIVVRVVHPAHAIPSYPDFSFSEIATAVQDMFGYAIGEIPIGKQNWYGSVSGIWQSVWLEAVYPVFFTGVLVTPDVAGQTARVRIGLNDPPRDGDGLSLKYQIVGADGTAVADLAGVPLAEAIAANHTPGRALTAPAIDVPLASLRLWDLHDPHLYRLSVALQHRGEELDRTEVQFGMRHIEARENRIFLNGRPLYIMGALDQDFYPETGYTPPSDEFLEDQIRKAKHMGLNLLRCHIKAPDPRYLDIADRMGMLVWEELPNWTRLTEQAAARGRETLTRMIERDYNHPSVVIWTIINESWGADLVNRVDDRRWLKQMYHYIKSIVPNGLVVDNSPCNTPHGRNFHLRTDIEDFHIYFAVPDHYQKWANWVRDFSTHPSWTFSYFGDAERTGQEPLMVSEFGNWGLPTLKDLLTEYGVEPSWFRTGSEETQPHGVQRRFSRYHLDVIFGSYDQFAILTQWHQYYALKYQIEEMRKYPSVAGYVITEFTDLHWEANGLLNIWRRPKVFYNHLAQFQAQDVVFASWQRINYWESDLCNVDVFVSHFDDTELQGYSVEWNISDLGVAGTIENVSVERPDARKVGTISFVVPHIRHSLRSRLHLRLRDPEGRIVARNQQLLSFFPSALFRPSKPQTPIWVHDPQGLWDLQTRLQEAGYRVVGEPGEGEERVRYAIVSRIDAAVARFIVEGGSVLFLVHSAEGISPDVPERELVRIRDRRARIDKNTWEKNPWEGDWVTNYNWLKYTSLFEGIPRAVDSPLEGEVMDFQYYKVMPDHVMLGWNPDRDFDDILSGIVVGWVHSPASLIAQCRWGEGKLLATTLKLESAFADDPVATILLQNLVAYLMSPRFRPKRDLHARGTRAANASSGVGGVPATRSRRSRTNPAVEAQVPELPGG